MIEIFVVAIAAGVIFDMAKKRGTEALLFAVIAVAGYVVIAVVAGVVVRQTAGPFGLSSPFEGARLVVGLFWLAACYFSIFLVTRRRGGAKSSWQCPECQFFNEPTTLVCPCGYRYERVGREVEVARVEAGE